MFRPFTFTMIIDMVRFKFMILFIIYLSQLTLLLFLLFLTSFEIVYFRILFYLLCCLNTSTRVTWCPVSWRPFISNVLSDLMVVSGGTINPVLITLSWLEASYDYLLHKFYIADWNWRKSFSSVTLYWQPNRNEEV